MGGRVEKYYTIYVCLLTAVDMIFTRFGFYVIVNNEWHKSCYSQQFPLSCHKTLSASVLGKNWDHIYIVLLSACHYINFENLWKSFQSINIFWVKKMLPTTVDKKNWINCFFSLYFTQASIFDVYINIQIQNYAIQLKNCQHHSRKKEKRCEDIYYFIFFNIGKFTLSEQMFWFTYYFFLV